MYTYIYLHFFIHIYIHLWKLSAIRAELVVVDKVDDLFGHETRPMFRPQIPRLTISHVCVRMSRVFVRISRVFVRLSHVFV